MPIPPEKRRYYGKVWREQTRPAMHARASVARTAALALVPPGAARGYLLASDAEQVVMCECDGRCGCAHPLGRCTEVNGAPAQTFAGDVIVGVAHLNQTPGDDRRENLLVLCQACHNRYDAPHRAKNAARSRRRRARAESPQLELAGIGQLALPMVHTPQYAECARAFAAHVPSPLRATPRPRRRRWTAEQADLFPERAHPRRGGGAGE